jgi:hypothetical protein
VRRTAQQIRQAMPQMLGTCRLAPPQGMAQQQNNPPRPHRKEVIPPMNLSIPLVVIFGITAFIAYRYMGLRIWHAIVVLIFGFLLAATTAAPEIHALLSSLDHWLNKP